MILLNDGEVSRLRELGLEEQRIQRLDDVLRAINKALPDDAPGSGISPANVRRQLKALAEDASKAAARLQALLDAAGGSGNDPVAAEAGVALLASASDADMPPDVIDALPAMFSGLARLAEQARSEQPAQRRGMTPWPICLQIWEVVEGARDSRGVPLRVSASDESTFVQVIAVALEALDLSWDARRLVENYIEGLKDLPKKKI